ncbi:MAG TPA: hypothetical protein VG937_29695 [Polyangiaceae bacterium]|nr:hypothetical protein [Polyangiaceae bacterium]
MKQQQLDSHELRRVAVEATCDPRSVAKVLTGAPTRPTVRKRVEKALRELGLSFPRGGELT